MAKYNTTGCTPAELCTSCNGTKGGQLSTKSRASSIFCVIANIRLQGNRQYYVTWLVKILLEMGKIPARYEFSTSLFLICESIFAICKYKFQFLYKVNYTKWEFNLNSCNINTQHYLRKQNADGVLKTKTLCI